MPKNNVTMKEAADILGVSLSTLYRWKDEGSLEKLVRIKTSALNGRLYMDRREVEKAAKSI